MSEDPTRLESEWSRTPLTQQQQWAHADAARLKRHTQHVSRIELPTQHSGCHHEARYGSPEGYSSEFCGSPVSFATPGSTSGESMNNHGDHATPPDSPAPGNSPGAAMSRLSLEYNDSHKRATTARRGRGMLSAATTAASKRAASSELARPAGRRSPTTGHAHPPPAEPRPQKSSLQAKRGQQDRQGRSHGGQRGATPRTELNVQPQPILKDELRKGTRGDSGYMTMPSRSNTYQVPQLIPSAALQTVPVAVPHPDQTATKLDAIHRASATAPPAQARYPGLILQPDSSPISQDQLAAEVKGIYAGLVMVEAKCINIDAAQAHDVKSQLGSEQWQALIALHRTLLYEHHDFLMATQHPSATPALRGLAVKYSMPARMWKHGIHAFLEVLRHRRPESQDYMLAFIYLAYQMMALLYETVPSFLDTWIECLGDLARYRMAIEEEKEAHAQWGSVAARWYTMAADRHPTVGRLNHHLGILERPSLRKLFYYDKALTCVMPFSNAKDSLATLCGPIVQDEQAIKNSSQSAEAAVVTFHAMIFTGQDPASIKSMSATALRLLFHLPTAKLRDIGASLAIVNMAGVLELGKPTNALMQQYTGAHTQQAQDLKPSPDVISPLATKQGSLSADTPGSSSIIISDFPNVFFFRCFNWIVRRHDLKKSVFDLLPFVHVMLVSFHSLHCLKSRGDGHHHKSDRLLGTDVLSWEGLSDYLNSLSEHEPIVARVLERASRSAFSSPERKQDARPLAEDFMMRGLIWTQWYFEPEWFAGHFADEYARAVEPASMQKARAERVQCLGLYLAFHTDYLSFDVSSRKFAAPVRGPGAPSTAEVRVPTPTSTPTTRSASSEEDGFTVVKGPKTKNSTKNTTADQPQTWANIASQPQKATHNSTEVRVIDEDSMDMIA